MTSLIERPLDRNVPRVLLMLAAAGYLVSAFIPWAVGEAVGYPQQYVASEAGEGVWMVIVGAALLALGVSDVLWEARSRTLQLLPLLMLIVSAVMWLGADAQAQFAINDWERQLGTGEMTATRWIALAALAANGVAWLLFERWRPADARAHTQPLLVELGVNAWAIVSLVVAAVFGMLGAGLALYEVITQFGAKASFVGLILAVIGLFAGAWIGIRLVRVVRSLVEPKRVTTEAPKQQ